MLDTLRGFKGVKLHRQRGSSGERGVVSLIWAAVARALSVGLAIAAVASLGLWLHYAETGRVHLHLLLYIATLAALQFFVRFKIPDKLPMREQQLAYTSIAAVRSDINDFVLAVMQLAEQVPSQMLGLTQALLLRPGDFRQRATEHIGLDRSQTQRSLKVDYLVDAGTASALPHFAVPVSLPSKGRLYDRPDVLDGGGLPLIVYAFAEAQVYIAALLLVEYQRGYGLKGDFASWPDGWPDHFIGLLLLSVLAPAHEVVSHGPNDRNDKSAATPVAARTNHEVSEEQEPEQRLSKIDERRKQVKEYIGDDAPQALRDLALLLTDHYVVLCEVPASERFTIRSSYLIDARDLRTDLQDRDISIFTRWVFRLFNVHSGYLKIPLAHARKAMSYHLYLEIPRGSYFGASNIRPRADTDVRIGVTARPATTRTTPYLRSPVQQLASMQLYARGLARTEPADLYVRIYEKATGSELLATLALAGLAIVTAILRAARANPDDTSDIATVVLTLALAIITVGVLFEPLRARTLTLSRAGVGGSLLAFGLAIVIIAAYSFDLASGMRREHAWSTFWVYAQTVTSSLAGAAIVAFLLRLTRFIAHRRRSMG